jgi:hypothetical protein
MPIETVPFRPLSSFRPLESILDEDFVERFDIAGTDRSLDEALQHGSPSGLAAELG